jgi:cholesterol transport system auxiliary component
MNPDLASMHAKRARPSRPAARWLAMAVLLGGCTSLQPAPVVSPNLHVLQPPLAVKAAPMQRDITIEIAPPRADPAYDTPQMAYVSKPYALDYFANNRWADSPARMLAPLLALALERTHAFRAVVEPPGGVPADLRVDTELARLQQDFEARPSRVELALRVQLVDARRRRVLATRTFTDVETAPSDDPYGGVTAANAALARVLEAFAAFCVTEAGAWQAPAAAPR